MLKRERQPREGEQCTCSQLQVQGRRGGGEGVTDSHQQFLHVLHEEDLDAVRCTEPLDSGSTRSAGRREGGGGGAAGRREGGGGGAEEVDLGGRLRGMGGGGGRGESGERSGERRLGRSCEDALRGNGGAGGG